jgi:hypothetical protein
MELRSATNSGSIAQTVGEHTNGSIKKPEEESSTATSTPKRDSEEDSSFVKKPMLWIRPFKYTKAGRSMVKKNAVVWCDVIDVVDLDEQDIFK